MVVVPGQQHSLVQGQEVCVHTALLGSESRSAHQGGANNGDLTGFVLRERKKKKILSGRSILQILPIREETTEQTFIPPLPERPSNPSHSASNLFLHTQPCSSLLHLSSPREPWSEPNSHLSPLNLSTALQSTTVMGENTRPRSRPG
jgi:hypothetical protein